MQCFMLDVGDCMQSTMWLTNIYLFTEINPNWERSVIEDYRTLVVNAFRVPVPAYNNIDSRWETLR